MKSTARASKINKAWLHDHLNDPYVKQAQRRATGPARPTSSRRSTRRWADQAGPGGGGPGLRAGRLEPVPAPALRAQGRGSGGQGRAARHASSRWTCWTSSRSKACTFIQGDFREDAVLQRAGTRWPAGRWTWWCRTWRPTCRASRRPTPRASRTWSNWRSSSPCGTCGPKARWSARCSTAAATASWSSCSRTLPRGQADQAQGLARQVG
jgi:hypothetical protein